ncbi:MAG: ABC transporter substrate-binding protein [Lachnospiraceae bacterium]
MKRLLALFFSALLILLCFGCGKSPDNVRREPLERARAPLKNDDLITVGFIQTGKESGWRDANTDDFLDTFTVEKGYRLIYIDGCSDTNRQVKAAYDLIAQNVDYIIIDPIIEDGWDDVLTLASEKDIPVIISDRNVSADRSLYKCWIGSNFRQEGQKAGKWLQSFLISTGRQNEDINIVILEGTPGSSATIGRTEGLLVEIDYHDNWHILTRQCANFTQGEGKNVMQQILTDYGAENIDVLIAENDNMMFGAMKAMNQAGVKYGVNGNVITISFDALQEAFRLMQNKALTASIECNPLIAHLAEQAIIDMEAGRKVRPIQYVDESIFTYENASKYINTRKY